MQAIENLYVRYCFVLDENEDVIDVTIPTLTSKELKRDYVPFKVFTDGGGEYMNAITESREVELLAYLHEDDYKTQQDLIREGIFPLT